MKTYRFKETQDFAWNIKQNWQSVSKAQGAALVQSSNQMQAYNLAIAITHPVEKLTVNLMDVEQNITLCTMTVADTSYESIAYAVDALIGYARDVMSCVLRTADKEHTC